MKKSSFLVSTILALIHHCLSVGYDRRVFRENRFTIEQHQTEFCYTKPSCSPNNPETWPGVCQTGKHQSPINIVTDSRERSYTRPAFAPISSFGSQGDRFSMWNNGHSVVVGFKLPRKSEIFPGYGLSSRRYRFDNAHLHWGSPSSVGSEHLINGRSYSMELHLVHHDESYSSLEAALKSSDPGALAVLAILFQVDRNAPPSRALKPIVDNMYRLKSNSTNNMNPSRSNPGDGPPGSTICHGSIDWTSILPTRHSLPARLFNYPGSLTTPGCNEVVDWFVYEKPNRISESDVAAFRTINGPIDRPMYFNKRPVMPLNNRKITILRV